MENFKKYSSQNVGQDFIVLDFFHGRKILKVNRRDPQNREKIVLLGGGEIIIQQLSTDWQLIEYKEVGLWHTLRWLELW
jgi:hypothetical protein